MATVKSLSEQCSDAASGLRVVVWGTFDRGKPRVRILLDGLRAAGLEVTECHSDVWGGSEDKSQIRGSLQRLRLTARWLLSYPALAWRYLKLPKHDVVLVGYMGHLDVLVIRPLAMLRGVPVAWDAFLSIYDTTVDDRALVSRHNPVAAALYLWEWLACRSADLVILDTRAHARFFSEQFRIPLHRLASVLVGAETAVFTPLPRATAHGASPRRKRVLFYGQFIPLHGIETIVRAAHLTAEAAIEWVVIGTGQESARIRSLAEGLGLTNIEWIPWVPYEKLPEWIASADICLGIFGDSGKAQRVIPNKAYQILACGGRLVTADTPAMRELIQDDDPCVSLVPTSDPDALAAKILQLTHEADLDTPEPCLSRARERITPAAIGTELATLLAALVEARSTENPLRGGMHPR